MKPRYLAAPGGLAAAAVLAWYLAPLVPLASSEYSYYAPLGVLVSMYPTVARSAMTDGVVTSGGVCGRTFCAYERAASAVPTSRPARWPSTTRPTCTCTPTPCTR